MGSFWPQLLMGLVPVFALWLGIHLGNLSGFEVVLKFDFEADVLLGGTFFCLLIGQVVGTQCSYGQCDDERIVRRSLKSS